MNLMYHDTGAYRGTNSLPGLGDAFLSKRLFVYNNNKYFIFSWFKCSGVYGGCHSKNGLLGFYPL